MLRIVSALVAGTVLMSCGSHEPQHSHGSSYELESVDELRNFFGNPLKPKERPTQTYRGESVPVIDIHLHPGTFESMGPLGQDFVMKAINVPWLPDSIKKLGLSVLSKFMISPYGFGIGIQQECLRAKISYCGLFAVHAPETWGVTSNNDIIKALDDRKNYMFGDSPYFFGLATVNMQQWIDDPAQSAEELAEALQHPYIVGIKLAFIHNNWPLNDRRFDGVYELAAQYDIPIYHHTGSSPLRNLDSFATEEEAQRYLSSYDPSGLKEIVAAHPRTKFIMGHMGYDFTGEGNNFMPIVLDLAESYPNVYLEMSAFGKKSHDPDGSFFSGVLIEVKDRGLVDRLIYGSDGPGFPGGTKSYMETTLEALDRADYSYEEAYQVLYKNFKTLSQLEG
ncbi:amidohydrolase family protein [Pseudobacteriovorax antillogorgiicola]|uniref:Predicted metal-dependent hydrolase, TIM-barrel fold n=1 Tax=Pseudobacteriovorax antillogorgiicola TaxID=1513793 RepID=A0A1Y6CF43_9BACT|nr:amidohydrolase family protein [Pseudobacteriovorax antillogorgiicola]TCS47904.1 putative TIM-barrel fold metal-dependent hydrolase [Pseudobacteriovorax antillogorgiicola]SMF57809.1 Predicted metal-dependent hydrolase, TIM-barrel fold [Pseudobacteriovorax antillogorgiicola]